jgi:hypothetical protein
MAQPKDYRGYCRPYKRGDDEPVERALHEGQNRANKSSHPTPPRLVVPRFLASILVFVLHSFLWLVVKVPELGVHLLNFGLDEWLWSSP